MISYRSDGYHWVLKMFRMKGSVFLATLRVALPCGMIAAALKVMANHGYAPDGQLLENNVVWSGFSFGVGFLIVFRTSQSYARFWEGCTALTTMQANWFDACSALISFTRCSECEDKKVQEFQGLVIRLFSMLHAAVLGELEESHLKKLSNLDKFTYELVDAGCFDEKSLVSLMAEKKKVSLIYTWIQNIIVEATPEILNIPAPILSRAFQQMGQGLVSFHEARKVAVIPFPFPYAQICDAILVVHWLLVPLVVYPWSSSPVYSGIFSFIQVFVLWALNFIALEIEGPYGLDENDLDVRQLQRDMNESLKLLVRPHALRLPFLKPDAIKFHEYEDESAGADGGAGGAAPRGRFTESFQSVRQAIEVRNSFKLQRRSELEKEKPAESEDGPPTQATLSVIDSQPSHVSLASVHSVKSDARARPSHVSLADLRETTRSRFGTSRWLGRGAGPSGAFAEDIAFEAEVSGAFNASIPMPQHLQDVPQDPRSLRADILRSCSNIPMVQISSYVSEEDKEEAKEAAEVTAAAWSNQPFAI